MTSNYPSIPNKRIALSNTCRYCDAILLKNGFQNGRQRLKCKNCGKNSQESYSYKSYYTSTNRILVALLKEGCGVLSIARVLGISKNTVLKRIILLGDTSLKPNFFPQNQTFQMDEMCVIINRKKPRFWIAYAIDKASGTVVDVRVGKRDKNTVAPVVKSILTHKPKRIYTDGLNIYPSLIPKEIHRVFKYGTNKIERYNLTIRTHVKRLARKTICYSKSSIHLEAHLKIYFWYDL